MISRAAASFGMATLCLAVLVHNASTAFAATLGRFSFFFCVCSALAMCIEKQSRRVSRSRKKSKTGCSAVVRSNDEV